MVLTLMLRFADMFRTRTIVLMAMGYLLLQLMGVALVAAKPLNDDQIQIESKSENVFPYPLPQDGQELSLFPENCNCGQNSGEITATPSSGFIPSDNFPFEIISQQTQNQNDFQLGNDIELITSPNGKNPQKFEKLQAKQNDTEDPNVIKQVIFIEPPEYVYKHDIKVQAKQRPRTVIYVFPPMVRHIYNVTDGRDHSSREEPKVFYLGGKKHFDNEMDPGASNGLEIIDENKGDNQGIGNTGESFGGESYASSGAYLPPPPRKRDSETMQESRQSYATTKNVELDKTSESGHKIRSREFPQDTAKYSSFRQTTTPPPQKHYRRFDYFSKTDYENLKSTGQLLPNSVQYRIAPLLIPPPSPTPPTFGTSSYQPEFFRFSSMSNRITQTSTTPRPESSTKNFPKVRLEYERIQHFPQYSSTQNDGVLIPPPLLQSGNDKPKNVWEWGHEKADNQIPAGNLQLQHESEEESINRPNSGKVTFPRDDMIASASEVGEESNFQIFPAFFKNYFYQGPTKDLYQNSQY